MQSLIVAVLVGACSFYALWALMPAGTRRALAIALMRIPHLPRRIEARLQKTAKAATGCGCDGCDRAEKKPAAKTPASQTISFHPRPRR
jgi:hypothetical protein